MSVVTIGAWLTIAYTCLCVAGILCVLWDVLTQRLADRRVSKEAETFLREWDQLTRVEHEGWDR